MDNTKLLNDFSTKLSCLQKEFEVTHARSEKKRMAIDKWTKRAVDKDRINKAIAVASETARVEMERLRLLHQSQMQLLEAQQQSKRVHDLYDKFFGAK